MRILLANCHRGPVGGIETYLKTILPALRNRGHEIGLLFEYPPEIGLPAVDSSIPGIRSWSRDDLVSQSGRASLERWRPNVVYLQGLESAELEDYLAKTFPTVLFAHNYYGTCTTGRKTHSLPQISPCSRRFGIGCLAMHYPRRCGGLNPVRALKDFRREFERNRRLPVYAQVAVASAHMYEEYVRNGLKQEKVCLLHLPITDPLVTTPPVRELRDNILMIGRLTDIKGCDYLIRAIPLAARLLGRTLTLSIAGSGAEQANLARLCADLGVKAQFAGWVDTAKKRELMEQSDLLVVPSLWPEPFGLVGLEAGCVGLPAVGFEVGGIPEWLIPGISGELAPGDPPTPEGLAAAICRALQDRTRYDSLCQGAWNVAKRFSLDRHLNELVYLLESVAAVPSGESTPAFEGGRV